MQTLTDLHRFYDGPVPQELLDAADRDTIARRRADDAERARDPEAYWLRRWQTSMRTFRRQLEQDRAALVSFRAERAANPGPWRQHLRRRTRLLRNIREDREELRSLTTEWLDHYARRLRDVNAVRTPFDRVRCVVECAFIRDGGSAQLFAGRRAA